MRFRNLLGPANRRYIQTLMVLTQALLRVLHNEKDGTLVDSCHDIVVQAFEESRTPDFTMAINDFFFELNIDNINLVKLLKYIKESNIMHKVNLATYIHLLITECHVMLNEFSLSFNVHI